MDDHNEFSVHMVKGQDQTTGLWKMSVWYVLISGKKLDIVGAYNEYIPLLIFRHMFKR